MRRLLDGELLQNMPRQFRSVRDTDNSDNIALLGDSEALYKDFSDTIFENYSKNNNADIFASEEYRERIQESDKLHEEAINFFEYDGASSQAADLLAKTKQGSKTIAFGPKNYLEHLKEVSADDIKGFYDL